MIKRTLKDRYVHKNVGELTLSFVIHCSAVMSLGMRNGHSTTFITKYACFSHSSEKIYVKCEVSQGLLPPEVTQCLGVNVNAVEPVVALELGTAIKLDPLFLSDMISMLVTQENIIFVFISHTYACHREENSLEDRQKWEHWTE